MMKEINSHFHLGIHSKVTLAINYNNVFKKYISNFHLAFTRKQKMIGLGS